jgi:hypothetical protein
VGYSVRDLWMFQATWIPKPDPPGSLEDEDSDDGEWTPSDDEGKLSSDSDSDASDLEAEADPDEIDITAYVPPADSYPYHRMLVSSRKPVAPTDSISRPSRSLERLPPTLPHETASSNWKEVFRAVVTQSSILNAHVSAILSMCPNLRSLYVPCSGCPLVPCLPALPPSTQLRELAVNSGDELRLNYHFPEVPLFKDFSTVERLTIMNTAYQELPVELPDLFPNLTHLRISLHLGRTLLAILSRFPKLTNVWFTPPLAGWNTWNVEPFLRNLRQNCPNLNCVRVDILFGSDLIESFGPEVTWDQLPFVRVRRSMLSHVSDMWICDPEDPQSWRRPEEDPSRCLYNVYTRCLEDYWALRSTGGGWDD